MVADGRLRIAEGELPLTEAGLPFHPDAAVFLPRPLRMKRAERLIFSRVL